MQPTFTVVRKGYDPKQVDTYLATLTKQYDDATMERRDRIEELKHDNARLQATIDTLQSRQQAVELALEQAIDKAKQIEYAAKVRYCLEGERLQLFQAKWTEFCLRNARGVWQQDGDAVGKALVDAQEELRTLMAQELHIGAYLDQATFDYTQERARLKDFADFARIADPDPEDAQDAPRDITA